jgi:hypothetical protein
MAAAKRAAGGKRFDLSDAGLPGLRLRFAPAGARSWVWPAETLWGACDASGWRVSDNWDSAGT